MASRRSSSPPGCRRRSGWCCGSACLPSGAPSPAVSSLLLWTVMCPPGSTIRSRFDPLAWHIHEMLFGFVMAAVAGFLLTAIPNWTKRPSVSGFPLAVLAGLWLLGRVACLISALVPAWLAIAADLSFPVALVGLVTREIVAGRNWRN